MSLPVALVLWFGVLGSDPALGQSEGCPDPADGSTDAPLHLVLPWKGEAAGYHVFFGSDPDRLEFRGSTRVPNTYNNVYIPTLEPQTKYYWRVESTDKYGRAVAQGPLWSFVTGARATGPAESRATAIDPAPYLAKYSDWSSGSSPPRMDKPKTLFGMTLESAAGGPDEAVVTTTGAIYVVQRRGLGMWRRIDPATNTIRPRLVAVLEFEDDMGPIVVDASAADSVVLRSSKVELAFQTDSFFFLKALTPISYRHLNLIANAPWNKGVGLNRIWTDGYGGSLHADISGTAVLVPPRRNAQTLGHAAGDVAGHSIADVVPALLGRRDHLFAPFAEVGTAIVGVGPLQRPGDGHVLGRYPAALELGAASGGARPAEDAAPCRRAEGRDRIAVLLQLNLCFALLPLLAAARSTATATTDDRGT